MGRGPPGISLVLKILPLSAEILLKGFCLHKQLHNSAEVGYAGEEEDEFTGDAG